MTESAIPVEPAKFTVSAVRKLAAQVAAQPPTKRRDIRDGEQPGLVIRVFPSGILSWVARYTVRGDKVPKDPTLGPVDAGAVSTAALDDMRRRVADIRRAAAAGRDLLVEERRATADRKAEAEAADARLRVKDAAELFLRDYRGKARGRALSASSVKGYRAAMDRLVARCGDQWADRLTAAAAMQPGRELEAAGKVAAAHSYSVALGTALRWLGKRRVVPSHLFTEVERVGAVGRRERVLEPDELADVLTAARQLGYPWAPIVELLACTGARRDEIGELRVAEIKLADGMILIPRERMKSRVEFSIPLTARTRALVEGALQARPQDSSFLFTTTGATPVSGWSKAKRRLDDLVAGIRAKRAGRDEPTAEDRLPPWVIHDLRRTLRTAASACRVDAEVKELLLAHVPGGLKRTYDRWSYYDERLAALEVIERRYEGHEAAVRGEPAGNVVELKRA